MNEVLGLSAVELLTGYQARELSPVAVLNAVAERIEQVDGAVGAFTTLCLERAHAEAQAAEDAYLAGIEVGPLAGVPFGVKDLFDSEDVRTTYGSTMFADHVPQEDAEAVRRAREAGAILVGKTQTHEFAWGITSVNPRMGTSKNPWAPDRISGGSSGGSAVALATQQVPLAIGSDTGGSIRVPASFCGVVGFKPTYGRISAAGVWPLARSLDHPGVMARHPADAALLLEALAGADPEDPATEDIPLGDVADALRAGVTGASVGVCPDLHVVPLPPDIRGVFDAAVQTVASLGGRIREIGLPGADTIYETFGTTQRAEALFTHTCAGLYPERAEEYGDDVRARLELAAEGVAHDYLGAAAQRQRLRASFARVFKEVDVLMTPVSAASPVSIDGEATVQVANNVDFRELVMSYTVPQDLVGLPACAVRAGFDELGIPVGVQFTGPAWSEAWVLGAAHAFYQATPDIQERWPEI